MKHIDIKLAFASDQASLYANLRQMSTYPRPSVSNTLFTLTWLISCIFLGEGGFVALCCSGQTVCMCVCVCVCETEKGCSLAND